MAITHVALDDSKRVIVAGILRAEATQPELRENPNGPRQVGDAGTIGEPSPELLAFWVPRFRNIGMFLEPGTHARPHSLDIFVAFAS